jgi:hypothetical protein
MDREYQVKSNQVLFNEILVLLQIPNQNIVILQIVNRSTVIFEVLNEEKEEKVKNNLIIYQHLLC